MSNQLYNVEQASALLNIPAVTLKRLARQRKAPVIKLGYRTLMFDVVKVRAALDKLEVKAV